MTMMLRVTMIQQQLKCIIYHVPRIMSLNFWSSLIWQVLFLSAIYRWGNNFREERQTFWVRIKFPHYPGFQRHERQEDSSETLKKRYGALDYEWGENSGRNVTDIVSRSSKPWSLQNWSCIHVFPLHSTYNKTCIYNILKQWPKAWPLWQNQEQSHHWYSHIFKGWCLSIIWSNENWAMTNFWTRWHSTVFPLLGWTWAQRREETYNLTMFCAVLYD